MTTKRQQGPAFGEVDFTIRDCYHDHWYVTSECGGVTIEEESHAQGRGGKALHMSPAQMDKIARIWLRWRVGAGGWDDPERWDDNTPVRQGP